MHIVESYIRELFDIRRTGEAVEETSYYPPLSRLINEIGKTLKPQVHCIINIKNRGNGIPDGGLFTAEQLYKNTNNNPLIIQLPARGAIEAKGTSKDILQIASIKQVSDYLEKYGQVLVGQLPSPVALSNSTVVANGANASRKRISCRGS